jgi:hypothetical protein
VAPAFIANIAEAYIDDGYIHYLAASAKGMSGGPLFVANDATASLSIFGVVTTGEENNDLNNACYLK